MSESPDTRASLLVRLQDPQDERAWSEFLEIYTPLVYQLARRRGFQDADAQDLSQEVFRAVAGAIDGWDPDPAKGSFRAWLFRIARNLMINSMAKQRRHERGSGDSDIKRLLEEHPEPSVDSTLFDEEYKRRLFGWASEQIRVEFREGSWLAFWKTSVEGEEPRHVAETLGITVGAVYIARCRVMARLRQKIEQVEGSLSAEG
jgi:RNA polymerase sigma factor (sigma-70 family)